MPSPNDSRTTIPVRRSGRRLAYWNGTLWAVGTGLASGPLVIYLAMEFGAVRVGLGVSAIKAAPHFAGLLRMIAPAMIGRLADRKRFCLGSYLLSALVLLALPVAAAPWSGLSGGIGLAAVVVLWCLYHLLEYLGQVALWPWLADLARQRVRGRFLGRRERWLVTGQAVAMLGAALFNLLWNRAVPDAVWAGYAIPALAGCGFLFASLIPLASMPAIASVHERTTRPAALREGVHAASLSRFARGAGGEGTSLPAGLRGVLKPFADVCFLRYVAFGCWFSFFNGIVQAAQEVFPRQVLGVSLSLRLTLQTTTRIGQLSISPTLGRWADRFGNRRVLMACVPVIASSTLFFCVASPARWHWIIGAWIAWIAYAGVNVCQPNLLLKFSPASSRPAYVAAYQTAGGLSVAVSMILGGIAFDSLRQTFGTTPILTLGQAIAIDVFQAVFLFGFLTRAMGALVLLGVREPDR